MVQPTHSPRRARMTDAPAISALVEAAYAHYPARVGRRSAPMDADPRTEIDANEVWVTSGDGALEAVMVLRHAGDHLFVDNLAVAPQSQGSGHGTALLIHAEARAASLGLAELRLLTHELMIENRAFYESRGWEPTPPPSGESMARVYFRRRIRSE